MIEKTSSIEAPGRKPGPYTITYRLKTFTVHETDPSKWQAGNPTRSSEDVYHLAESIYRELDADKEHFIVLMLNNKNRLSGFKVISTGSLTASLVHPREVYSAVLELRAAAIILMHNHPSGDPTPSTEDKELTRRLAEVGQLVGINVLDHIIIGSGTPGYMSFRDTGLL